MEGKGQAFSRAAAPAKARRRPGGALVRGKEPGPHGCRVLSMGKPEPGAEW